MRSAGDRAWIAVRRCADLVGLDARGLAGAAAAGVAVVVALGLLVSRPWHLVLVATVLAILAAAVVLVVLRVLRPLRALTRDVQRAADGMDADAATEAGSTPITTAGARDLVALAAAVTTLRDSAVSHHRDQVRTSELMVHLGRRNQGLLDRLAARIADLAVVELNPRAHAELDRLGHVAGRARRHAESALVLADAAPDRLSARPAALVDVLRTASAGIEDHARVDTHGVEPAAIAGSAVADLAHLLAELVENAAHFSPPDARVDVAGAPVPDGYRLRITDRGVGMADAQLDEANERLRPGTPGPGTSGSASTRLVGLDIVGRLAARHGISVALARGEAGGVVTTVTVPGSALVPLADLPAPRRPVSALVASAAFLPPRPSPRPVPKLARDTAPAPRPARPASTEPASPEPAAAFVRPGVPRRVRGAQLPDLGPARDDDPRVAPEAGRVRGRLDALQAGLSAARTNNIPPLPRPLPGPDAPRVEPVAASPPAARAPASDDD